MGFFSGLFKKVTKLSGLNLLKGVVDQFSGAAAARQQREQSELARKASLQSQIQARKAEVFSQTEGAGQGTVGQIRSGLNDVIDEDEDLRQGKSRSSLRI